MALVIGVDCGVLRAGNMVIPASSPRLRNVHDQDSALYSVLIRVKKC